MIKNYFRNAFRHLWKNKTSSAINIFGLAIGLTCCLLIATDIQHEPGWEIYVIAASIVLLSVVAAIAFRAVRAGDGESRQKPAHGAIRSLFACPEATRISIGVSIFSFYF